MKIKSNGKLEVKLWHGFWPLPQAMTWEGFMKCNAICCYEFGKFEPMKNMRCRQHVAGCFSLWKTTSMIPSTNVTGRLEMKTIHDLWYTEYCPLLVLTNSRRLRHLCSSNGPSDTRLILYVVYLIWDWPDLLTQSQTLT